MYLKTLTKSDLLHKLQTFLPRTTLVTFCTAFVRPHLDYRDLLYDQAFNNSFHYCPVTIIKKFTQLICVFIGLEVLDDG